MKQNSVGSWKAIVNSKALLFFGIMLVAFNLRPALTSVGPLINFIRSDTGISFGLAGLLTTFPLLAFAILSPLAPKLGYKFGSERIVLVGLILLGVGIFVRSSGMVIALYVGTAFVGLGIAIGNVLLPGIVKDKFPNRMGLMTGMYSASIGVFASLAPGISTILAPEIGWGKSLSIWIFLAIAGGVLWFPQLYNRERSANHSKVKINSTSIWRSSLAWQVTLFMGLQSLVFYCMITWLPEILISQGFTISTAGWLLVLFQFSGIPTQFITPIIAGRLSNQKVIAISIGILNFIGLIGLATMGNIVLLSLCIILLGVSQGAALSYALALFGLRTTSGQQASSLSGMAQSIGYLLAALGPLTIGLLVDRYHTWTLSFIILVMCSIVMTIMGIGAGRDKMVIPLEESTGKAVAAKL